jgi:hypothetical protein
MSLPNQPNRYEVIGGLRSSTLDEYHATVRLLRAPPPPRPYAGRSSGRSGRSGSGSGLRSHGSPIGPIGPHHVIQIMVPQESDLGRHLIWLAFGKGWDARRPLDIMAVARQCEGLALQQPKPPPATAGAAVDRKRPDHAREFFRACEDPAVLPPAGALDLPNPAPSAAAAGAPQPPLMAMTRLGRDRPLLLVSIPPGCLEYRQLRISHISALFMPEMEISPEVQQTVVEHEQRATLRVEVEAAPPAGGRPLKGGGDGDGDGGVAGSRGERKARTAAAAAAAEAPGRKEGVRGKEEPRRLQPAKRQRPAREDEGGDADEESEEGEEGEVDASIYWQAYPHWRQRTQASRNERWEQRDARSEGGPAAAAAAGARGRGQIQRRRRQEEREARPTKRRRVEYPPIGVRSQQQLRQQPRRQQPKPHQPMRQRQQHQQQQTLPDTRQLRDQQPRPNQRSTQVQPLLQAPVAAGETPQAARQAQQPALSSDLASMQWPAEKFTRSAAKAASLAVEAAASPAAPDPAAGSAPPAKEVRVSLRSRSLSGVVAGGSSSGAAPTSAAHAAGAAAEQLAAAAAVAVAEVPPAAVEDISGRSSRPTTRARAAGEGAAGGSSGVDSGIAAAAPTVAATAAAAAAAAAAATAAADRGGYDGVYDFKDDGWLEGDGKDDGCT